MSWQRILARSQTWAWRLAALAATWTAIFAHGAESQWVKTGATGRLIYVPDAEGDRILDFSAVGYRGQGVEVLPTNVPVVATVSPTAGDDTATIQAAINQAAALPMGPEGFRGVVLLEPGDYDIATQLQITSSGIVLRGSGSGGSGTVLHGRGTGQRTLVEVAGSGSQSLTGSARSMIDKVVPAGATSFRVNSTSGLAVGDTVRVTRPTTANWISDLGMDMIPPRSDGGTVNQWTTSTIKLRFDRVITRIEGNRVFLDAPLPQSFEQQYGGGTIQKYVWPGRINNVGIENLRGDSDFTSPTDEDHAWDFVSIDAAQNVWVRDIEALHFGGSAVVSNPGAKWVTVDHAANSSPVSIVTGERRYSFDLSGQLDFVGNSSASEGRHDFVNNSTQPAGPHVFTNSVAHTALDETGPHQRWATGTLFDNIVVEGDQINARNRGNFGTGHGWAGANMVVWNSTAESFIVQNPPTAQNWLVGSQGAIIEDTTFGPQPSGYYDQSGPTAEPVVVGGTTSLYEAQRNDARDVTVFHARSGVGAWNDPLHWQEAVAPLDSYRVSVRDYLIGDIDDYAYDGATSVDHAVIDPGWQTAVAAATGLPTTHLDDLAGGKATAFTVEYALDPGERVVHAFLAASMKQAAIGNPAADAVRLFNTAPTNTKTFAELGWASAVNPSDAFVGVLDLGADLAELQSGAVNVQLGTSVGVDWALYAATVATPLNNSSAATIVIDGGGIVVVDSAPPVVGDVLVGMDGPGALVITAAASLAAADDYIQYGAGVLDIELDPAAATPRLGAGGTVALAGALEVDWVGGGFPAPQQQFTLISAGAVVGAFDDVSVPAIPADLSWRLDYQSDAVVLRFVHSADFNGDGAVAGDDLMIWRQNQGAADATQAQGDADGNGQVDGADFLVWQRQWGAQAALAAQIPEPAAGFLALPACVGALWWRASAARQRTRRR